VIVHFLSVHVHCYKVVYFLNRLAFENKLL